jgi:hypothetical protein
MGVEERCHRLPRHIVQKSLDLALVEAKRRQIRLLRLVGEGSLGKKDRVDRDIIDKRQM